MIKPNLFHYLIITDDKLKPNSKFRKAKFGVNVHYEPHIYTFSKSKFQNIPSKNTHTVNSGSIKMNS